MNPDDPMAQWRNRLVGASRGITNGLVGASNLIAAGARGLGSGARGLGREFASDPMQAYQDYLRGGASSALELARFMPGESRLERGLLSAAEKVGPEQRSASSLLGGFVGDVIPDVINADAIVAPGRMAEAEGPLMKALEASAFLPWVPGGLLGRVMRRADDLPEAGGLLRADAPLSEDMVMDMGRRDLQGQLKDRGLPATGTTEALRDRLNVEVHREGLEAHLRERALPGGLDDVRDAQRAQAYDPEQGFSPEWLREEYPVSAIPEIKYDKKNTRYHLGSGADDQTEAFAEARRAAQDDIELGNYDPYFDPDQRFHVDPTPYPTRYPGEGVESLRAKTARKRLEITDRIDNPEVRRILEDAINLGRLDPNSFDWYAVGQMEQRAIEVAEEAGLGAQHGRDWFRNWAEQMAATTAGQAPSPNMMMANYNLHMGARGARPAMKFDHNKPGEFVAGYDAPQPVMGQYIGRNVTAGLEHLDRVAAEGPGFPVEKPKGFSFSRDFLGDVNLGTMDKQMSQGAIGRDAPNANEYWDFENAMRSVSSDLLGRPTSQGQDVAWAGFKSAKDASPKGQTWLPGDVLEMMDQGTASMVYGPLGEGVTRIPQVGKPMIGHINESIERTARLTGQTPDEVFKSWVVRGAPALGVGGLLGANFNRRNRERRQGLLR